MEILSYLLFLIFIIILWKSSNYISNKAFESVDIKDYAIKSSGIFIIKMSLLGKIIDINSAFLMYMNYKKDEIKNRVNFEDLLAPNSKMVYKGFLARLITTGKSETEVCLITHDKKEILVTLYSKVNKDYHGNLYYLLICKDISENYFNNRKNSNYEIRMLYRELAEYEGLIEKNFSFKTSTFEKIKELESRHKFIVDSTNIGMLEIDFTKNCCYFSNKCKELFELNGDFEAEKIQKVFSRKILKEDYYKLLKNIHIAIGNKLNNFKSSFRIDSKDNIKYIEFFAQLTYNSQGELINLTGSISDITSSSIYQEKIKRMAYYDRLTGLFNRAYMEDNIDNILNLSENVNSAFLMLDIDNFKFINDSFGHSFGDNVIREISSKIRQIKKYKNIIISRFSGDEIAIFISDYGNFSELLEYVEELTRIFNLNYEGNDTSYTASASMGISLSPLHGNDFETLLKFADIAMNEAKATGKNKFLVFNEEMNKKLLDRIALEKYLEKAIVKKEGLSIYLQPQFNTSDGKLCGFEALTRWNCSVLGNVTPDVFIPIAEETRLIIPLGKWIFSEACNILKNIQDKGFNNLKISVNLSPVQLMDTSLIETTKDILQQTGINTDFLEIEITETALMENFDTNIKKLYELKKLGIRIALDDFGTGYSSLTYLKRIPMSTIKIDKSFIDNISVSEIDKKIIQKIIELSHVLNFKTIAEGVETVEQLDFIKKIGCDIVQGFFNGGFPIKSENVFEFLENLKKSNKT